MKTTNTIYINNSNYGEYVGVKEAADKAFQYIKDMLDIEKPFSEIIKHMPESLGYTLHSQSFELALIMILEQLPQEKDKRDFLTKITKLDDLDLYEKLGQPRLEMQSDAEEKYAKFERDNNYKYMDITREFIEVNKHPPEPTNEPNPVSAPITDFTDLMLDLADLKDISRFQDR